MILKKEYLIIALAELDVSLRMHLVYLRKPILLEPNKATKVVLAAVYLYNYIRKNTSTNLISPELFDGELDG